MWELDCEESWAPKNWCFWTVVLEKSLESPLDFKEIQPVHSKGDSPGCSLEGLMLKLKLQYYGHLMRRVNSLGKTLMLGRIGGRRRKGQQRMRWWMASSTQWMWVWVDPRSWWYYPTVSSSVIPFSSHLKSFPASGSSQMSQFFTSGGQSIGVSASTSVLPMNTQRWSPLGWTGWISLQSRGLSKVSNKVQKHEFFGAQLSL